MVMIELVRECSVGYELRLLKKILRSRQCVFFVRYELRLEKQLRTVLFFVAMHHVVVISLLLGQPIGPILTLGFLTAKDGTNMLSRNIGHKLPQLAV